MAYQKEARANADQLESEIDSLERGHWDNLARDYRSFFNHDGEIRGLFKTLKPLQRDDRERLWSRLNAVCNEVTRVRDSARQDREIKSANHKEWILKCVFNAEVRTLLGFSPPGCGGHEGIRSEAKRGSSLSESMSVLVENG